MPGLNITELLRERAADHRENGWELMREGDPTLLEKAANEIERLRDTLNGEIVSRGEYEIVLADHRRLVRELDVALNGEAGAAQQASLCDIVGQVKDGRWKLVRGV